MIPKILHQMWKDHAVPAGFSDFVASWKRYHSGWQFKFWTDLDLAEFVETRYPLFADQFREYPKPVMRADLARYLLLREFGGVYADLDAEALTSFEPLIAADVPLFAFEPPSHSALEFARRRGFGKVVSNAIILSPIGHPFWDHLLAILRRCRHAENPLDATGPFVVTAAIASAATGAAPRVLPAHVFSPADKAGKAVDPTTSRMKPFAMHHWAGTWWKGKTPDAFAAPRGKPPIEINFGETQADARRQLQALDRSLIDAPRPKGRRVLIAVPVRDAAGTLDALFERILALRYPRQLLSLAFLESGSSDDSLARLDAFVRLNAKEFRRIVVLKRDSGATSPSQPGSQSGRRGRHATNAGIRNAIVRRALQNEDWVLWIGADIIGFPPGILRDLISTGARIVQPNTVRSSGGPSTDLNAWVIERRISPKAMANWIDDGLYHPPDHFNRLYLSDLRYRDRVALHGVGGSMLLVDANLHRAGLLFPTNPYRFLIETEGFGAAARDAGIVPIGLPNVEIIRAAELTQDFVRNRAAETSVQQPSGRQPSMGLGDC